MSAFPAPPAKLDRKPPEDFEHVEKYPVRLADIAGKPTPVILGINWYDAFDTPVLRDDERWYIPEPTGREYIRGGHCICVKSKQPDQWGWYQFYDQGEEGACVGFGISRTQTLMNRVMYDAFWLYDEARKVDEWPGEDYDGTSVNAGLKVAKADGLKRQQSGVIAPQDGISAYRWATSVDEVHGVIQLPIADELGAVPLLNSWGRYYPHLVWLPDAWLERLLSEDGEAALVTDR
ncbi:MAG TPA: hypothetical protein VLA89_00280 [Gemmatimonadales bacterium]|nr:hypothetical protein [Gemmatimonadales bacterium]